MKILMLCDSMDCGGAETHVLTLSSALVARGHSVCVISRGGRLVNKLLNAGVRHITVQFSASSPLSMLAYRSMLCRLLKSEGFDIVHAHSRLTAFLAHKIAFRLGTAFVVTAHACFSLSPLRRRFSCWGSSTIAVSEDIKQYLIKNYSLLANNVAVIANGVDENRFYPTERRMPSVSPRIAFLSRLDSDCSLGAHLLCEIAEDIFAKYPDATITIGGAGDEFEKLSKTADALNHKLGKKFINCVGEVKDTARFFHCANIFVGVSRAAIEAGLSGLPIILCGNEGFSGLLTPRNFARAAASNFCARGEIKATAELLKKHIFSLICDRSITGTEKIRELFLKSYSLKSFAESTENVYKSTRKIYARGGADTLLCGYYGYGNVGDDALMSAALKRTRREFPNEKVAIMTKNSKKDSLRFAAHSIKRSSPLRVFFAISRCKRLIFGGGTLLQSSTSRRSLFYYSALLIIAGRLKKECFLWANGIELPYGSFCKKLLRAALKNCSHIGVRDTPSLAIAKELAPRATAVFEEDLAKSEFSRKSNRERADFLLREAFGDIPDRFVIAVPRIKARSADVALLVKALVKERNRKNNILVIPMCPREDMEICEEICEDLGAKMIEGACFDDIVELSKLCLCVYSMRYHGLVAAALAGTEHIGIGNSEKIETYCKENGIKIISSEADE